MAEPSGAPFSVADRLHLIPFDARHRRYDKLGYPVPSPDDKVRIAKVRQNHLHLPTIVRVDRPGRVEYSNCILYRKSASWANLRLITSRNFKLKTGRNKNGLMGCQKKIFLYRRAYIHAGGTFRGVSRECDIRLGGRHAGDSDNNW